MKHYNQLYKSNKTSAIVSVIETFVPSLTEEMILRAGAKLAKDGDIPHVVIVYKSPITESDVITQYIEKYSSNILYYQTADDIQKLLSKYKVEQTVCESSISDRFQNSFQIQPLTESLVELAIDANKDQFKKNMMSGIRDIDAMFIMNLVREQYKIGTISEQLILPKSQIRESFFNGELGVGSTVETKNGLVEIISRGSNYFTVVDFNGTISKQWPADVTKSTNSIDWSNNKNNVNEFFYKGFAPSNFGSLVESSQTLIKKIIEENRDPFLIRNTLSLIDEYILTSEERTLIKVENNLDKLTETAYADKLEIASIIAKSLDYDFDEPATPESIIEGSLNHIKDKTLSEDSQVALANMLAIASKYGIYESRIVVDKTKTDNAAQGILTTDDFKRLVSKLQPNPGHTLMGDSDDNGHRTRKVNYLVHEDYDDIDFSDSDIDDLIKGIESVDDVLDYYDDDELNIVDLDTDEIVEELVNEEVINEVLSKTERIRAKMRFAKTKAKRERKLEIALKRRSTSKVLNSRARRLAVATLKKKIAKKPLENLSVSEKERLERFIEKRKDLVKRVALKLVPKVRKIETTRLEHKTTQKE